MVPTAPVRVAMVGQGNHPIPPSGYAPVEKHIAALAEALRRQGADVTVVNRVLPRFRFRLLAHALWVHRQLRRMRPRPDVVHCHSPINARILARLGHPVVFTSHSREWVNAVTALTAGPSRELRLHQGAFRASRARILLSRAVADAASRTERLDARPTSVVPNGVDVERYAPTAVRSAGPAGVRAEPNAKRLVGIGVVARVKRWHLVAQAIQGTGWTFELLGPLNHPDYAAELRAMPGVTVRGPSSEDDIRAALRGATALAHPSGAEAMSLAVLEGMASGLPVLCSPAAAEAVRDGADGFVVPEAEEAAMVAAYRALLTGTPAARWAPMGRSARQRVVAAYSWDEVARQTLAVYAEAGRPVP